MIVLEHGAPQIEKLSGRDTLCPSHLAENGMYQSIIAELDDSLWQTIEELAGSGYLVLCMGAGSIDGWLRTALQGSAGRR